MHRESPGDRVPMASESASRRLALRGVFGGLATAFAGVTAAQAKRGKKPKKAQVREVQGESASVTTTAPRVFLEATCSSAKQTLIGGGFTCTDNSGSSTGVQVAESRLLNDGGGRRYVVVVRNPTGPTATCTAFAHCLG